jgi:UDP-glucose 4-epimerase
MSKRALVTGGAGFIGSNLVYRLVMEGWDVTIADDLSNGHKHFLEGYDVKKLWVCFASERVLGLVRQKKFDVVFHQAAVPRVSYSVEHPYETSNANINKTIKLLDACRGNITRFVFASSSSVYGGADLLPTPNTYQKNPKSPYALQKSVCEEFIELFCDLYDIDAVSLRYFNVFGPNQYGDSPYSTAVSAWCNAIKNDLELRSDGTGEQSRDMCYVDNVVEANILVANSSKKFNGKCYNVACGDRTTNNQILEYFKKNFDNVKIRNAPWRAGDVMHTQADIGSANVDFGYEPLVRFWDGLEKTIKWWGLKDG